MADVATLEGPLADREAWSTHGACSIERAMGTIGTRSAMLLMREAYYGTRRFDDFTKRVGITEAVAAKRLRELVDAGLLERTPYQSPGQRTRHEYRLTPMGRDLLPAVLALMQWGDRYLSDDGRGPLALRHAGCGAPVRVEVRCQRGHDVPLGQLSVVHEPHRSRARQAATVDQHPAHPTP
jgi:DNA-binding HxlR family transcriptional regulator